MILWEIAYINIEGKTAWLSIGWTKVDHTSSELVQDVGVVDKCVPIIDKEMTQRSVYVETLEFSLAICHSVTIFCLSG